MKKIFALVLATMITALSISTVAAESKSKTLIVYFALAATQFFFTFKKYDNCNVEALQLTF